MDVGTEEGKRISVHRVHRSGRGKRSVPALRVIPLRGRVPGPHPSTSGIQEPCTGCTETRWLVSRHRFRVSEGLGHLSSFSVLTDTSSLEVSSAFTLLMAISFPPHFSRNMGAYRHNQVSRRLGGPR